MRAIWSGHITFGLVSIPVGLYAALEASEKVSFRLLHRKDHAPIRYKKFCSEEDVEVPGDEIVRGYEVQKGEYALVEDEEIEAAKEEQGAGQRVIDILQFADLAAVNPLLFEKPYYVAPQKGGAKAYAVLRAALLETKRVGIARFFLRTKPLLAALMPAQELLSLEVIRDVAELRDPHELSVPDAAVRAPELQMARTLIEQMTAEWDATAHPNTYRATLEKLLEGKERYALAGKAAPAPTGKVIDLMEALQQSLGRQKEPAKAKPSKTAKKRPARRGAA